MYKNMATFCFYCGLFGHLEKNCSHRVTHIKEGKLLEGQYGSWLHVDSGWLETQHASSSTIITAEGTHEKQQLGPDHSARIQLPAMDTPSITQALTTPLSSPPIHSSLTFLSSRNTLLLNQAQHLTGGTGSKNDSAAELTSKLLAELRDVSNGTLGISALEEQPISKQTDLTLPSVLAPNIYSLLQFPETGQAPMTGFSDTLTLVEMDEHSDTRIESRRPAIFKEPKLSIHSLINIPIEVADSKRVPKV